MQIGHYKNRTLEDAKSYLKCVFGISLSQIDSNPQIKAQIEANANEGYILDCLLKGEFHKIGRHE